MSPKLTIPWVKPRWIDILKITVGKTTIFLNTTNHNKMLSQNYCWVRWLLQIVFREQQNRTVTLLLWCRSTNTWTSSRAFMFSIFYCQWNLNKDSAFGSVTEDASSGTDEEIFVAADAEPTWLLQRSLLARTLTPPVG